MIADAAAQRQVIRNPGIGVDFHTQAARRGRQRQPRPYPEGRLSHVASRR